MTLSSYLDLLLVLDRIAMERTNGIEVWWFLVTPLSRLVLCLKSSAV